MSVFDLTEIQANYILDMPLRRLTKFSRIELEKEKTELEREIEELDAILADDKLLRKVVSDELGEVAKTFGTPRRTVLLESAGTAAVTAADHAARGRRRPVLRAAVLHRPARPHRERRAGRARAGPRQPRRGRLRGRHHGPRRGRRAHLGRAAAPARRARPARAPAVGQRPQPPGRAAAQRVARRSSPTSGARAVLARPPTGPAWRSAPRRAWSSGSTPSSSASDEWEVIALKDGDEVVGAVELPTGEETLCFITSDAQLLHFGAGGVRPQGRSGGGMAGIKLGRRRAGRLVRRPRPATTSVVVTVSGSSTALPGTEPGAVKVTPFTEYPAKGRATGGVRCHRFLKGEDTLVFAWAGPRSGARRGRQRRAGRPPRGHRPARRLRRARQPADRGLRRTRSRTGSDQPPVWKADRMLLRHRAGRRRGRRRARRSLGLSACSDDGGGVTENERRRRRRRRRQRRGGPRRWPGPRSTRPAGCSLTLTPTTCPTGSTVWSAPRGSATHAPAFEGMPR